MRKLIDIVSENEGSPDLADEEANLSDLVPSPLTGKITKADLERALAILISGHSLDGVQDHPPRDPEFAIEDLEYGLKTIAKAFDGEVIHLYRAITASHSDVDLSKPGTVGIYWTYNPNFTMSQLGDEGYIELEGTVDAEAIDWPPTICLAIDGVEDEVRLVKGAKISRFSASVDGPVSSIQFA